MSTLFVNNLNTASGSTITVPTGKVVVGTDGQTFRAPGMVIQTKFLPILTQTVTTSTSYIAMNASNLAITPSSTSNKILITFSYHVYIDSASAGTWRGLLVRLMRVTGDTVLLADPSSGYGVGANWNDASDRDMVYATSSHLDSPNSTSAITYGLECRSKSGSSVDINASGYGRGGFIQLQEIAQ